MMNPEENSEYLPVQNSKKKKLLLIGFCIILVTIILIILFLPSSSKKRINKKSDPISKSLNIDDRSKTMVDYIEKQLQPNGYYQYLAHYDALCRVINGKNECPFGGAKVFPSTNAWTALAYYSIFGITGDNAYLKKAEKDIKMLQSYCKNHTDDECRLVLVQPYLLYEKTQNSLYKDFLLENANALLKESTIQVAMVQAIESRELIYVYLLTKDDRYKIAAEKRLEKAKTIVAKNAPLFITKEGYIFRSGACWVTLAQTTMGRVNPDSQELKEAEAFMNDVNIYSNYGGISLAIEQQPCIDTYFELASVSRNSTYSNTAKYYLKNFIDKFWDSSDAKKVWGEGGTASTSDTSNTDPLATRVNVTDSAYTIYLLYRAKTTL